MTLTCAFGEPWIGKHPKCAAYARALARQFREAVRRGELDAQGYTPKERRGAASEAVG